jgi:hypothetical protein
MAEDHLVVVLAGDHDELVPGAWVDNALVVDLGCVRVTGMKSSSGAPGTASVRSS